MFNTEESSTCANFLVVGVRVLLSEFHFPAVFPPFGVKLEVDQTHLEFSVPTIGVVSVTFGGSEQAALSSSLCKCLWISRCCSQLPRRCQPVLNPIPPAAANSENWEFSSSLEGIQLLSCGFSMAHPNQAMLLSHTAQKTRSERKVIPASATERNFGIQAFPKKLCPWGKVPEPRPELSSAVEQG